MRLSKKMSALVHFANWCRNNSVEPLAMAELITLADRVWSYDQAACNYELSARQAKARERLSNAFHAKATELGFGVEFYGMYPTLQRDGRDIQFPSID